MKKLALIVILFGILLQLNAHPWKPKHYVVIDTDGGFDDFRAITLMLASPEIRVLAITASPGVLKAEDTYTKVNSLLMYYYNEGILSGINNTTEIQALNCFPAKEFAWGTIDSIKQIPKSAIEVISYVYNNSCENITFISLGSLNTANYCIKNIPDFNTKTKSIIWSVGLGNFNQSFNYKLDINSYKSILKSNIIFNIIDGNSGENSYNFFSDSISGNKYSENFSKSISNGASLYSKVCFDEKTVLFLHYPQYFSSATEGNVIKNSQKTEVTSELLNTAYTNILNGNTLVRSQVLKQIPIDTTLYQSDIQPIINEAVFRYGKEEWQAAVLANEMHRHLGVVATLGVKMGIRAREYFAAGLDELYIISYAGYNQPLSCLNDGLQASTGATLGHALITVDTTVMPSFAADFVYMGRTLKVTLKPEIQKEILTELRELNYLYGLKSDIYWELVRKVALKYWKNLDRHEIFILDEL